MKFKSFEARNLAGNGDMSNDPRSWFRTLAARQESPNRFFAHQLPANTPDFTAVRTKYDRSPGLP